MTMDFETQLRRHLHDAANNAPQFLGLAEPPAPRRNSDHPRRRLAPILFGAAAAAVATVAVGAVVMGVIGRGHEPGGEAACAALVDYDGVRYVGMGEVLRSPRPGKVLGEARVLGCDDGNGEVETSTMVARSVRGIPPGTALMTADGLFVAETVTSLPAGLENLRRPLPCDNTITRVSGIWTSMEGPMPSEDGSTDPPYVAVVVTDKGTGLPLDRYSALTLPIRVTPHTTGATERDVVVRGLQGGETVTLNVHCAEEGFVADQIALAP